MVLSNAKPLFVTKDIKINAYDIDFMLIVNNIVYVRWFEDLRFLLLDEHFPVEPLLKDNISPILSNTHVSYKQPLTIYDKPKGKAWLSSLGRIKWEVTVEISIKDKIYCSGVQNGCFYNIKTMRPIKTPEKLRELYEKGMG